MKRAFAITAAVLLLSSCSSWHWPTRALGPGEQWVPFQTTRSIGGIAGIGGISIACAGTGWVGDGHVLMGSADDPRLVWMMVGGERKELEFPVGYSARFTPRLELLDEHDKLVGIDGTVLVGGCEYVPGIWWVDLPQVA